MAQKKLQIAIVGAGFMAEYHVKGFREANAEIACIVDANIKTAKAAAEKYAIPGFYGSIEEMLDKIGSGIDAISIITPNKFHKPLSITALNAGKHVFCEKPPALNAGEVLEMKNAAEAKNKVLLFNFNNRARPESYAMMDYIKNGDTGRIKSAQAVWIRRAGIPGFGGWFTNKKLSGGGPVIDLLHMTDLALYFMGYPKPEYVLAQTFDDFIRNKEFKGPWGIPDVDNGVTDVESSCHGFVRFSTGQVLFIRNSWAEMNKREEVSVTFQGEKAGGLIRRLFGRDGHDNTAEDSCELYIQENGRSVNRTILADKDESMGRIRSAVNFVRTIEGLEKPLNTPDQALSLMKIVDAVYESAKTGKPIGL